MLTSKHKNCSSSQKKKTHFKIFFKNIQHLQYSLDLNYIVEQNVKASSGNARPYFTHELKKANFSENANSLPDYKWKSSTMG